MRKLLYILLVGAAALSGCVTAGGTGAAAEPTALESWSGAWNNFYSYFDRPALNRAYAVLAEKEGKTPDEIKKRYLEGPTYQCEIAAMDISGNTVRFFRDPPNAARSGAAYQAEYADRGDVDINGRKWRHFETAAAVPYTHLLLLPAEADVPGETMMHFHFRYGNDLSALKNAEGWYATMVSSDSTDDLLIGHMTH